MTNSAVVNPYLVNLCETLETDKSTESQNGFYHSLDRRFYQPATWFKFARHRIEIISEKGIRTRKFLAAPFRPTFQHSGIDFIPRLDESLFWQDIEFKAFDGNSEPETYAIISFSAVGRGEDQADVTMNFQKVDFLSFNDNLPTNQRFQKTYRMDENNIRKLVNANKMGGNKFRASMQGVDSKGNLAPGKFKQGQTHYT